MPVRFSRWMPVMWVVAIVAALSLDAAVADWIHQNHPFALDRSGMEAMIWRRGIWYGGRWQAALGVCLLIAITHPPPIWNFVRVVPYPLAAGSVEWLVKCALGRTRPFHGVAPLTFHPFSLGPDLSMPSGHAILAFTLAALIGRLWPKARWIAYPAAALVAVERVLENAHYLSDVVLAAALGFGIVSVLWRVEAFRPVRLPCCTPAANIT